MMRRKQEEVMFIHYILTLAIYSVHDKYPCGHPRLQLLIYNVGVERRNGVISTGGSPLENRGQCCSHLGTE